MSIEEAIELLRHVVLSIVQRERVTTPALQRWVIAELLQDNEMAHGSRYLALLSFGLWYRAAQLAQVAINDDGMSTHVVLPY